MTKAEIDDIFGEFEIDEDYMIKTKDVSASSLPSRRSPRSRSPPLLRRPLRPSLRRTPTPRRRRRRRPPSKLAAFSTFLPRLWPPLTSRPTLKTPHSKQDTDNMGAEIIQTILSPSKLAPFSTFLPRLWPTLTSRPTLKTPHSKQDTDNMGAEIIQTILSPGI